MDLDITEVYNYIFNDDYTKLVLYDQLNQEKDLNNIFHNFYEGQLNFLPTYQFIPGTNSYDQRIDKKMRCPAWCDRILWRIGKNYHKNYVNNNHSNPNNIVVSNGNVTTNGSSSSTASSAVPNVSITGFDFNTIGYSNEVLEKVELLLYESLPQFIISDHKPVRALLSLNVKRQVITYCFVKIIVCMLAS